MAKKPAAPRPRDPAWRTRRALGAKRIESEKQYDRAKRRAEERDALKQARADDKAKDE